MMCGGATKSREADAEVQALCDQLRGEVQSKAGKEFSEFKALHVSTQIVNGTNYFVKVHVGNDECVHVRIYKPLSGDPTLHSVQLDKSKAEPIGYFG